MKTSKSSELNLDHFYFSNLKFREPLECGMNVWLVWFRATVSMAESTLSGVVVHDSFVKWDGATSSCCLGRLFIVVFVAVVAAAVFVSDGFSGIGCLFRLSYSSAKYYKTLNCVHAPHRRAPRGSLTT